MAGLIEKLSETVGLIYDCVAHEHLWPEALGAVAKQVDAFLVALAVFDTDTHTTRLAHLACENKAAVSELTKYAGTIPFYHLLHRMEVDEPMLLENMFELYGPDGERVWKETDLYRNWHSQFSIPDSINVAVLKRQNRVATLNVAMQRDTNAQRLATIALLAPHIRRAVIIHDMLQMERSEAAIFRELIDRIEHGVVIVAETMEIIYANPAAETFLRAEALLSSSGGRLVMRFPQANAAVKRAVSLGVRDEVELANSGIDIPLGATSRPAVAHVLPLQRRAVGRQIESRAAAAVFIAAAGSVIQTSVEAIAALFGLTVAEKRVAGYVAHGMTRNEIAEAQAVTAGTVKSQLAAIYDKTGTGDQRSLQILMRELSPAVRRG